MGYHKNILILTLTTVLTKNMLIIMIMSSSPKEDPIKSQNISESSLKKKVMQSKWFLAKWKSSNDYMQMHILNREDSSDL